MAPKPNSPEKKTESVYKPPDFVTRLSGPVTLEENERVFQKLGIASMNLTPCYPKDAQIALDSQANNMKIKDPEQYKALYEPEKAKFQEIQNEESEVD